MARSKKRKYVRKEDKLNQAEAKIARFQQCRISDAEEYDKQVEKLREIVTAATYEKNQLQVKLTNAELEVRAANRIAEDALQDLANIKESILQHQRTLELVTQTAHNNAQMGRDLISSLTIKNLVTPKSNVVGMTNADVDKIVNVNGHG